MNYYDTIAAVSTPRGKGGVAMIRISGPDALAVGDSVFSKKLSDAGSNLAIHGEILIKQPNGEKRVIDDGVATVFRSPRSFTGEDTVELCCHGGVLITSTVLSACLAAGARQAEAGEFTRRAFVNGKLRLDSAEALGALLEAKNENQLRLARSGMSGRLAGKTEELYENLLSSVSELRANIDFPDEDVSELTPDELCRRLGETLAGAEKLAATYATGRAVSEGISTVICGRTNSGKSSLYNRLVGYEAAIVTSLEGTTRDLLTDTVSLGGVTLRLCDTAGLRDSDDPVEKIGVGRAYSAIEQAELILFVADGSRIPDELDRSLCEKIRTAPAYTVAVINKSDLPTSAKINELTEGFDAAVTLSAKTGEGFDKLADIVSSAFIDGEINLGDDPVVTTARQYGALIAAVEALKAAVSGLGSGLPADLVCSDAETALKALGEVGGRETDEDIVDSIFSRFCVGK